MARDIIKEAFEDINIKSAIKVDIQMELMEFLKENEVIINGEKNHELLGALIQKIVASQLRSIHKHTDITLTKFEPWWNMLQKTDDREPLMKILRELFTLKGFLPTEKKEV